MSRLSLIGLFTAGALLAYLGIGQFSANSQEVAEQRAKAVLISAESWQESESSDECPTLSVLSLRHEDDQADPWGSRFRIQCSADGIRVRSPGQDGKLGTDDDIIVGSNT